MDPRHLCSCANHFQDHNRLPVSKGLQAQSVHGLARTLKDFLEQQFGITLESRMPLLVWLVEHCSNLLLLFHKGEPHGGHTANMRLKGKQRERES